MDEAYTPEPPRSLVACADYGPDKGCCGLIMCNECGFVVAIVTTMAEAEETLMRMAIEDGVCSELCTVCGETNVFTGYSAMEAFTCRHCGAGVEVKRAIQ